MSVAKPLRRMAYAGAALAAAGTLLLVAPWASADTNGVANPGFESGTSGWTCAATATAVTGHAHSGTYALAGATTTGDTAQCTQTVAVVPGTSYTLSAQVNGAYVYLGVTGGASMWTPGTGGAYQNLSVTFTATASTAEIYLHGWYGQGTYYADDVTMPASTSTPTSAPTSAPTTAPTTTPPTTTPPTTAPTSPPGSGPGAALPACPFFTTVTPPVRTPGPSHPAGTQAPAVSLDGRLAAPGNVQGTLSGGSVTVTFGRVAGAVGYRVWRNGVSVLRIDDWGQATLSITDTSPCRNANYTVAAYRTSDDSDASIGQLSTPYKLLDSGSFGSGALAPGTQMSFMITSYNDAGQTSSGYNAGLGFCAVDTRQIPWGTRFYVDGYGYCYAADVGTWIQGQVVDVWLPGTQADAWGVQQRTITIQ